MKNLTQSDFLNISFAMPPTAEQFAIVAFLDHEISKIDCIIGKVESAIAKLSEYRTALITAAVTGKIDVQGFKP